jgi:hypothetical protein
MLGKRFGFAKRVPETLDGSCCRQLASSPDITLVTAARRRRWSAATRSLRPRLITSP